jgi:hypothetical protein
VFAIVLAVEYGLTIGRDAGAWDRAAAMQRQVIGAVRLALPRPPSGSVVYAFGFPIESAPGVPVFVAPYDLGSAVALAWNDPSLSAYPVVPGSAFVCGARSISMRNWNTPIHGTAQQAPYGRAFVIDVSRARAVRIADRAACLSATQAVRGSA